MTKSDAVKPLVHEFLPNMHGLYESISHVSAHPHIPIMTLCEQKTAYSIYNATAP
jgi:hypothetical protein